MEEANFLTPLRQRSDAGASPRQRSALRRSCSSASRDNPKIKFLTNTVVEDVYDADKGYVTGVKLRNLQNERVWDREVDGFFVAIGHIPNTKPFIGQIDLDPDGYIVSHGGARTNIAGVFHAGDVQDRTYRQAITASGAGCMAAIEAERFLEAEGE